MHNALQDDLFKFVFLSRVLTAVSISDNFGKGYRSASSSEVKIANLSRKYQNEMLDEL